MRRVRLLIYDGPEEWLAATKAGEFALLGRTELGEGRRIVSIEVDPLLWSMENALTLLLQQAGAVEGSGSFASRVKLTDKEDSSK